MKQNLQQEAWGWQSQASWSCVYNKVRRRDQLVIERQARSFSNASHAALPDSTAELGGLGIVLRHLFNLYRSRLLDKLTDLSIQASLRLIYVLHVTSAGGLLFPLGHVPPSQPFRRATDRYPREMFRFDSGEAEGEQRVVEKCIR
jgi:hypothetical protein